MKEFIEKRQEYINEISKIRNEIDVKVDEFKTEAIKKLNLDVEKFKQGLIDEADARISIYQKRINFLSEIIMEDMPEAKEINDAVIDKEEVVEQPISIEEEKSFVLPQENEVIIEETKPICDNSDHTINCSIERPGMMEIKNPR